VSVKFSDLGIRRVSHTFSFSYMFFKVLSDNYLKAKFEGA